MDLPRHPHGALRVAAAFTGLILVSQLFLADPAAAGRVTAVIPDKAAHMLAFGALALLAWAATGGRWPLAIFGCVVAVGIADEAMQSANPRRHGDPADLAADALAAAAMLAFLSLKTIRRSPCAGRPVPNGG